MLKIKIQGTSLGGDVIHRGYLVRYNDALSKIKRSVIDSVLRVINKSISMNGIDVVRRTHFARIKKSTI